MQYWHRLFFCMLILGCKGRQPTEHHDMMSQTVRGSITEIEHSSAQLYRKLEQDYRDSVAPLIARRPQVSFIYVSSKKIYTYLDNLITKQSESFNVSETTSDQIFDLISNHFEGTAQQQIISGGDTLRPLLPEWIQGSKSDFYKHLFKNSNSALSLLNLLYLKLNLVNLEHRALSYIFSGYTHHIVIIDDFPAPLVTQNATVLKKGDQLQITAGIGTYATRPLISITINGEVFKPDKAGRASFSKPVTKPPGKYSIPVVIKFKMPEGNEKEATVEVKYEVAEPE
jgi:hypothetical protein